VSSSTIGAEHRLDAGLALGVVRLAGGGLEPVRHGFYPDFADSGERAL
jgi:hypothetical protein